MSVNNYGNNVSLLGGYKQEEKKFIIDEEDVEDDGEDKENDSHDIEDDGKGKEFIVDEEDDETHHRIPGTYGFESIVDDKKHNVMHESNSGSKSLSEEKHSIEQHIVIDECDLWLDVIVDDVMKGYDILEFKTKPFGAERNIYVNKQFTQLWSEYVTSKFNDEYMMYYWLDYTNAAQITEKYSKQHHLWFSKRIEDLNKINCRCLKLFKSQSTNNDPINKSITITQKIMKEYCNVALERLNNSNNLIPVLVIDKHNNYYNIEWILIVNIIHRNCDVGISFKYNDKLNIFTATAIYLDKAEIESRHKLFVPTSDYCKHIKPFSWEKFKIKSDDNDDIVIPGIQQQIFQYKKAFEGKKVQQLEKQLFQIQKSHHLVQETFHINLMLHKR